MVSFGSGLCADTAQPQKASPAKTEPQGEKTVGEKVAEEKQTVDKETARPKGPDFVEAFDAGYKAFLSEKYPQAAGFFFKYIDHNSRDAENFEWAEFFFGLSLEKMGYSHAAVEDLSYLVTRKPNTKIVSHILEYFEELTRTSPYDHEKVINLAVVDQDYGFVSSEIKNFIHFHQGLFDWKNEFNDWGDNHFSQIRKGTYYYFRYQYQRALYMIVKNEIDTAIENLDKIIRADFKGEDLKNEARKTLARLYYEVKEYEKADDLYQEISDNIVFQAQNLLERSWAQYRIDNQEKAMGLLYAFKAPVYSHYFTPEYFLLKSLIYKGVCHYRRALSVIDEFRGHYHDALKNIYERGEISDNHALLLVLLGKKKVNDLWHFLLLLEKEKGQIESLSDPSLAAYLNRIYDMQIQATQKEFRLVLREQFEIIANDLLEYEEKADLMAYEIGLDMYQRVYQYHYEDEKKTGKAKNLLPGMKHYYAFFPFQDEFWSDELDNYKVILEDKCTCMEEWDIFFK
jgi:hypothetical protein